MSNLHIAASHHFSLSQSPVAIVSAFLTCDHVIRRALVAHGSISAAPLRGRNLRRPLITASSGIGNRREGQSHNVSRAVASAPDVHSAAEYAERVQLPRERLQEGDAAERPSGKPGVVAPAGGRSQASWRAVAALRRDAEDAEQPAVQGHGFTTANKVQCQRWEPRIAQHCCCGRP